MLNPHNIGMNVFQIADDNAPKYYFLNVDRGSENGMGSISVAMSDKNVNLIDSVHGTMEEIEEQLIPYVWEHIKNYDAITTPFKQIELPTDTLLSDRITSLHRIIKVSMYQLGAVLAKKTFRFNSITHVIMHSDALEYLSDVWGFNIKEKIEISVSINNNLPRHRMIFTHIAQDKIMEGNTCLVYKKIEHADKTFSVFFSIITENPDTYVSIDIPHRIFRKNKIDELL